MTNVPFAGAAQELTIWFFAASSYSNMVLPDQWQPSAADGCPLLPTAEEQSSALTYGLLTNDLTDTVGDRISSWVTTFQRELSTLKALRPGWDSYDAPTPSNDAIVRASEFLDHLWGRDVGISPSRVAPTVDGSVVISFLNSDTRANIEFFDESETAATIASGQQPPRVWEIEDQDDLDQAIDDIRDALKA